MLKEYIARGTLHLPAAASRCGSSPTSSRSAPSEVPHWNTISISGYHIREAGSTAAQELAFTLAERHRVRRARARARVSTIDDFGPALVVLLQRATTTSSRRSRSSARRAGCGPRSCASASRAKDPRSWTLRFHAQTAGSLADGAADRQQRRARDACRRSPRCSAARSRCTPTATTRRSRCPTEDAARAGAAHAAGHRPRERRRRHASIRSPAATSSRRSPTRSRPRRSSTSSRSTAWAAR